MTDMLYAMIAVLPLVLALEVNQTAPPPRSVPVVVDDEADAAHLDAVALHTAVRVNGLVQGFDFTGLGVEVGRTLSRRAAVEASIDGVDLQRGLTGTYFQAMGRFGYFGPSQVLSVGGGLGLLDSLEFGAVAFAYPEAAYEFRAASGFSIAAGLGVPVTLNDSKDVPCGESGFLACFLDTTQFHRGDVTMRVRLAFGYSF